MGWKKRGGEEKKGKDKRRKIKEKKGRQDKFSLKNKSKVFGRGGDTHYFKLCAYRETSIIFYHVVLLRFGIKCDRTAGSLDVSQPHGAPWPVTGTAFVKTYWLLKCWGQIIVSRGTCFNLGLRKEIIQTKGLSSELWDCVNELWHVDM
jgi:hypothetical protein